MKDLLNEINNIKKCEDVQSLYNCYFNIWFNLESKIGRIQIITRNNLYLEIMDSILNNEKFKNTILDIVGKDQNEIIKQKIASNELDKEKCKLLNAFIHGIGLTLAEVFNQLNVDQIMSIRKRATDFLKKVEQDNNFNVNFSNISSLLYLAISKQEYINKVTFPKINQSLTPFITLLRKSRMLTEIIFLTIPQILDISDSLEQISSKQSNNKEFDYYKGISHLYKVIGWPEHSIEFLTKTYKQKLGDARPFLLFLEKFRTINEKITIYILIQMTKNVFTEEINGEKINRFILKKIENIDEILTNIKDISKKNLLAFQTTSDDKEIRNQWSNKLVLASVKTASAIRFLTEAKDVKWKISVFKREYSAWIKEVHLIINRMGIDDDWEKIKNDVNLENNNIEWKSTFFTPTQIAQSTKDEKILDHIIKTLIGMMNSEGGSIIVGLVERPEEVKNLDIKSNIINKNGLYFFDIRKELINLKISTDFTDYLKRRLQEKIRILTNTKIEKTDLLWDIEPIELHGINKSVIVFKIKVTKSLNPIYLAKSDEKIPWITLVKRFNGRTEFVDPREYIK